MRPKRLRFVRFNPNVKYFKPAGVPIRELEEVMINYEEAEAIRLKYVENLDQENAAKKMNISRSTFQRILSSALSKVADFITNGKALRVEGGNFRIIKNKRETTNET